MTEANIAFAGSIPEFYERNLRPILFEPYAVDLAMRAVAFQGPVLELACGTGILTRQLLTSLPKELHLTATDLNPPMLEEAQRRVQQDPRLQWRQADMTALPFPDGAFGAVVCQFGFMFPPDKVALFREAHRVLHAGGVLLFNVWASLDENPANRTTLRALARLFPDNPPTFLDLPFGFHDETLIHHLMQEQGFTSIHIEPRSLECRSESAKDFATGLVRGTPLANDLQSRAADFDLVERTVAEALAELGGDAPFQSPMKALVVSGAR